MSDHLEYYRKRAVRERELPEAADDPRVAASHAKMADQYDGLVAKGGLAEATILRPDFQKRWSEARRLAASTDAYENEEQG